MFYLLREVAIVNGGANEIGAQIIKEFLKNDGIGNSTSTPSTSTSTLKAIDLMRADRADREGQGGTVINISSVAALTLLSPKIFIYCATKIAILHFSNCIGKYEYYRHTKVRVITMCFSVTDTEILSTMDSIDDIVNEGLKQVVNTFHRPGFIQPPGIAARGVVEAYNNGDSESTWLVDNSKITNITDDVLEGMSKHTTVSSLFP